MIQNYFKIAWRTLFKSKVYSFINIGGLAVGMAVALLIGLWMNDELTFDQNHSYYRRIAQVMQHQSWNGEIATQEANPAQMAEEIRHVFGSDFTYVLQASWNNNHTLTYGEKMFDKSGSFFEPGVAQMLTLHMLAGTRKGLEGMNSILLSQSVAEAYFGQEDPVGKVLRLDNKDDVKVTGVYEDLSPNSSFADLKIIMPWSLYLSENPWIAKMSNPWGSNFTRTFAMIAENADMEKVSSKIKDVKFNKANESEKKYKAVVFLHPMSKWHLYSDFKGGINVGGAIQNVWLFGTIGFFVLILACINFMNLSTARSEKRAKEVGIRKSIGSVRTQLITQFFGESLLIAALALGVALLLVALAIPSFNQVAGKHMTFPWNRPVFWLASAAFSLLTGLLAGCYPALFLSSFKPVSVLKGTFRIGHNASLPRKVLVVLQFSISTVLIIGTLIVYDQIQYAQDRPMGYNKSGLIWVGVSKEVHSHFDAVRTELINAGAISQMAESGSPVSSVWNTNGGFDWEGKDPNLAVDFPNNPVTVDYGKAIGWTVKAGRDFSRDFPSDSNAFILNEAAVAFIGLKEPLGKVIRWENRPFTVIGVVKDVILESPYTPVRGAMWHLSRGEENVFMIKINPAANAHTAMAKIEEVFRRLNPTSPFSANFVDEEYARKFGNEKRISQLSTFFAVLAVLISCLGLFGLASYVAEQRTKEIGIRKVLGASVANLWRMLSQDFVLLVIISSAIAIPIAYYGTHRWLQQYEYRTTISWGAFVFSVAGAIGITLLTVSFQAIKASTTNPVNSLRSE